MPALHTIPPLRRRPAPRPTTARLIPGRRRYARSRSHTCSKSPHPAPRGSPRCRLICTSPSSSSACNTPSRTTTRPQRKDTRRRRSTCAPNVARDSLARASSRRLASTPASGPSSALCAADTLARARTSGGICVPNTRATAPRLAPRPSSRRNTCFRVHSRSCHAVPFSILNFSICARAPAMCLARSAE